MFSARSGLSSVTSARRVPASERNHEREPLQARMKNPAMLVPEAMQALLALGKSLEKGGVPARTRGLVHLRTSQINGCSVCLDMHRQHLKKVDETEERLFAVAAWRDTP